jgi:multicomponent Na+:H+ antiporter subunit F
MNLWLISAAILLVSMTACLWVCLTASLMERFAALQMAQLLTVLVLLLLAEGYRRAIYFDLALVMAVLSFASGLVYVRFLERWL